VRHYEACGYWFVEDNVRMAALLRRGLKRRATPLMSPGTVPKESGWVRDSYDAIVLDVMLPSADGFAVCRALRAADRWAR